MVFSRLAPEPVSRHAARRLHSLLPLFAKNMQSSNTAGFMSSVLSSMSSLEAMAQLLSESQLIPVARRNKPDCFTACLAAMEADKSPMEFLQEDAGSEQTPKTAAQPAAFIRLVLVLTNAENPAQLSEAERLMDDLITGSGMSEDEANAIATIHSDRSRAIRDPAPRPSFAS